MDNRWNSSIVSIDEDIKLPIARYEKIPSFINKRMLSKLARILLITYYPATSELVYPINK